MRAATRLVIPLLMTLVAAACGAATDGEPAGGEDTTTTLPPIQVTTTTTRQPPLPEARLLLRVDGTGGFVPVEFALTDLVDFSLYSDGRVILGPLPEGFPPPAVRQYVETRIDEQTLVEALGFIDQLGIANFNDESNSEMHSFVADAETTVVEYFDEAGDVHRYSVYALGMNDFEDADGRVAVTQQLAELVRSIDATEATPVPITELLVWIGEVTPDPSFHKMQTWEFAFPPIPLSQDGFFYACIELSGDDATAAVAALENGGTNTLWDEGGTTYSVVARPMLEGESGCDDADY